MVLLQLLVVISYTGLSRVYCGSATPLPDAAQDEHDIDVFDVFNNTTPTVKPNALLE